ncbi:hypothetical protein [Acidipila rosea]|uniref:Uncharacterized protein n=1 Tax=Acidipila rosea TaxID=768535 RepID=A0A4R1LCC0_9BACT|nr:hypothetical protein [Acidipila rosea]TCK75995.1 hypothetical protein C7378_1000 [Acidipila rosea]
MKNLRNLLTIFNLHIAVLLALVIFNLVLVTRLLLAWHASGEDQSATYEQAQVTYGQLKAQMGHLTNLPAKVGAARTDADDFYSERIAPNYSTVASELDGVATSEGVRLSRAQYTPSPAIDGLAEVRIDASLSGEYAPLMRFINGLERDKNHVFFIVDGLALSGQQGGLVNLRLRLTTYLRSDAPDLQRVSAPEAKTASEGTR